MPIKKPGVGLPPPGPAAGDVSPSAEVPKPPLMPASSVDSIEAAPCSSPDNPLRVDVPTVHLPRGKVAQDSSTRPPLHFGGSDYQLRERVGKGASGSVYLFENAEGKQLVGKWCRDEKLLSHEARVLKHASSVPHPNVAAGKGYLSYCGRKILLMEYVPGGPLKSLLRSLARSPGLRFSDKTDACRYLVYKTLSGLAHLHQQGIVHRDIKPENILWDDPTGEPKIADFGISLRILAGGGVADDGETQSAAGGEGTPHYMAPELVTAEDLVPTSKVDIWAMGAVLYEMVRGESRFDGENIFALLYQVRDFGEDPDNRVRQVRIVEDTGDGKTIRYVDEPTAFGRLVNRMMHPKPEKRPEVKELLLDPFFEDMTDPEILSGVKRTLARLNDGGLEPAHQLQRHQEPSPAPGDPREPLNPRLKEEIESFDRSRLKST